MKATIEQPPRTETVEDEGPLAELTARLSRLADPLFACAVARAGDREVALEATQEALVAAVRASDRETWPDEESLWFWLCAVLRNKLADEYRRRSRRTSLLDDALRASLDEGLARGVWPPEAAASAEVGRLCRAALSSLPPAVCALLTRHYLDGLTQPELARELETTTKAVESRMARARQALRAQLGRMFDHPEELL